MTELHQHTGKVPRITVLLDSENEGVRKRFHCPVCGKVAFEYFGSLRGLVPGAQTVEKTGARTVIHCTGKCMKYRMTDEGELEVVYKLGKHGEEIPMFEPCRAQLYV